MIIFLSVSHGCSQTQVTDPAIPKTEDYSTAEMDTQNSTGFISMCAAVYNQNSMALQSDNSPEIQSLIE